jgi:hypothetical protein
MVGLGWVGQRPLVVARVFTGAPLPMMVGPTRKSYETQLRLVFCVSGSIDRLCLK